MLAVELDEDGQESIPGLAALHDDLRGPRALQYSYRWAPLPGLPPNVLPLFSPRPALPLYLEDFAVGQKHVTASVRMDAEAIKAFARQFDPQPFHLDDEAGRGSLFDGLAASGWHTAALTMRLLVDSSMKPAGGIIGTRAEELRWPRPVRPGDELHVEAEILEVRASRTRPGEGYVKCRSTTINQQGEPVQMLLINLLVRARES